MSSPTGCIRVIQLLAHCIVMFGYVFICCCYLFASLNHVLDSTSLCSEKVDYVQLSLHGS